jgi:ABC-type uncharacterized transport system substrate-binding protein
MSECKETIMWYSAVGCIVPLLLSLIVAPLAVDAQPTKQVPRVGYLSIGSSTDPARLRRFEAFRQGLRERGYVDGQTIALEPRWAEGMYERYPALAADLVRVPVDVIVAVGGAVSRPSGRACASAPQVHEAEAAARAVGVQLQPLEARSPQEIESAFAAMTREQAEALVVLTDSIFTN